MTVEHALPCKVGGLVHIWHDNVADEIRHLCGTALSFGPWAPNFSSANCRGGDAATTTDGDNTSHNNSASDDDKQQPSATAECGNASCHGFWKCGCTCIFDVRITGTDVRSQWNKDVSKILAKHEKGMKEKTFVPVMKWGRTLPPWFTLLTVLQEEKQRTRKGGLQPSSWTNGNGHTPRWESTDGGSGCASEQPPHPWEWELSVATPLSSSHCWGCHYLALYREKNDVLLNDGIEKIGTQAFARCSSLEIIKFSSTFTEVGKRAFCGCENLTDV
ncbi:LOW QUALITY PROTEIN: hypothetical protein ACHAXR_004351 [Thalassiosira sp. AJA248-18]